MKKRILSPLTEVRIGLYVFVIAVIAVVSLTIAFSKYDGKLVENVLVEAHGMLMDLLVIGVFTLWLNIRSKSHIEAKLFKEQIDDFRPWHSEESSYRIAGLIKRLNEKKEYKIDLYQCSIQKVPLKKVSIKYSECWAVNFHLSTLNGVCFEGCKMKGATFDDCTCSNTSFQNCFLKISRFVNAKLQGVVFTGSVLIRASFENANLKNCDLRNTDCEGANFIYADLSEANLLGARNLTIEQILTAKNIKHIKLDDRLISELKVLHPEMIKEFVDTNGNLFNKIVP